MKDDIGYNQIQEWLDEDHEIIDSIDQVHDRDSKYHFRAMHGDLGLSVVKKERSGPLVLGSEISLQEKHLQTVRDSRRDQFFGEIESVLANSPGVYAFTDGSGSSASNDDFTAVLIKHWIYSDGASQHILMSAIIDMLTSLTYIRDTVNRIHNQVEGHR